MKTAGLLALAGTIFCAVRSVTAGPAHYSRALDWMLIGFGCVLVSLACLFACSREQR